MTTQLRILSGSLDEVAGSTLVLRGRIDPATFDVIRADAYQREVLAGKSADQLVKAFKNGGTVPDITLGMRGHRIQEKGDVWILQDGIYVVDGLQRLSGARRAKMEKPDQIIRLGATIYFDTTPKWEREMFAILNDERIKVSPNVLARNMREDVPVIGVLYALTNGDKAFVLNERVCWSQRMKRADILYALTYIKTIGWLHGHIGPGRSNQLRDLAPGMQRIMELVGKNTFRDNVRTFYDLVEECWGIRNVVYKGAVHLRMTFQLCLAQLFSRHNTVFFEGKRLVIDRDTRKKLAQFPVGDPTVMNLASSGGQGGKILYHMLLEHVNRGRRTRRLIEATDLDNDTLSPTEESSEDQE